MAENHQMHQIKFQHVVLEYTEQQQGLIYPMISFGGLGANNIAMISQMKNIYF